MPGIHSPGCRSGARARQAALGLACDEAGLDGSRAAGEGLAGDEDEADDAGGMSSMSSGVALGPSDAWRMIGAASGMRALASMSG